LVVSANLAVILPVGNPTNALVFQTGYINIKEMVFYFLNLIFEIGFYYHFLIVIFQDFIRIGCVFGWLFGDLIVFSFLAWSFVRSGTNIEYQNDVNL
jgi:hypothetical protein